MQQNFRILCHSFWPLTCLKACAPNYVVRQNARESCQLEWIKSATSDGSGGKMIRGEGRKHKGSIWVNTWRAGNDYPVIWYPILYSYTGRSNCSKAEIYPNLPELTFACDCQRAKNLLFTKSLHSWKVLTPSVCAILRAKLFIGPHYAATFCLHFISTLRK